MYSLRHDMICSSSSPGTTTVGRSSGDGEGVVRGRGEGRVAGDENDDAAFFQVAHGAAADERLGDILDLNGGLDARVDADFFERLL